MKEMKRKVKRFIMGIRMRFVILSERDEVSSLSNKIKSYKNSIQDLTPETFKDISPINRHDIRDIDFEKLNEKPSFNKLVHPEDLRKDLTKYGHNHSFTSATPNIFSTSKTVFKFIDMSKEKKSKDDNPEI